MFQYPDRSSYEFDGVISNKAEFRELMGVGLLYPHQELVRRYMSPYTPYDNLLLYHSMGTGKTFICIAIAEDHYNYSRKKCIVLTKGSTSKNSYKTQIIAWLRRSDPNINMRKIKSYIDERYIFGHHISFCKSRIIVDKVDPAILDNIVLVVDEVHNINPSSSTVANPTYENLKSYIHRLTNSKVLLLSGTPLVNDTRKLLSILPMILPNNVVVNDDLLYDINALSKVAKGYVSYYHGDASSVTVHYNGVSIPGIKYPIYIDYMKGVQRTVCEQLFMSDQTDAIYNNNISASLFVFNDGSYGSKIDSKILVAKTIVAGDFISAFMDEKRSKYKCKRYILDDRYVDQVSIDNLADHSCKYYSIIKEIISRDGQCCFVFIKEIVGSGLSLFSAILESLGYELYYGQNITTISRRRRYTMCVGDQEISPNNRDRIAGFNHPLNIRGEYVQVILGSAVVGESITLLNVRHFHSVSPHWNDSVIEQAMRRVIRTGSHDNLPPHERTVDIFLHASYISNDIISVDVRKLCIAQTKESHLDPLRDNLRFISIEHILSNNSVDRINLDCSTYINYITKQMLGRYVEDIKRVINRPTTLDNLSNILLLPIDIVKYTISQCILDSIPVRDYYGRTGYIRESYGIVSITRNRMSYPIDIEIPNILYKGESVLHYRQFDVAGFIIKYNRCHPIEIIESMMSLSWDEKISVLETSILVGSNIKDIFSIYIIDDSYHIYNYRRPNKGSYKSLLVGIRCKGLTRYISDDNTWSYLPIDRESVILSLYNSRLNNMRSTRSVDGCLYTISTTDMIIRVITVGDSFEDRRNYSRGRSLDTLPKEILYKCYISILGYIGDIEDLVTTLIQRNMLIYV